MHNQQLLLPNIDSLIRTNQKKIAFNFMKKKGD